MICFGNFYTEMFQHGAISLRIERKADYSFAFFESGAKSFSFQAPTLKELESSTLFSKHIVDYTILLKKNA